MEGLWYKLCPHCGNYVSKEDPLAFAICCSCGWEEHHPDYFCETANRYCRMASVDVDKDAPAPVYR